MTDIHKQRARTLAYYLWLSERASFDSPNKEMYKQEFDNLHNHIIDQGLDAIQLESNPIESL